MGLESGGSIADNSIEEEVEADESSDAIRLESQGGTKRHESSVIFNRMSLRNSSSTSLSPI